MMNPLCADLEHILGRTRSLWEELRGERIFITGGTGLDQPLDLQERIRLTLHWYRSQTPKDKVSSV